MRTVSPLVAAAVMLVFSACDANQPQETSSTTLEEAANATDIAETTAASIDTAAFQTDSLSTDSTGVN